MADIWDIVAEMALELHPDRLEVVASRIDALPSAHLFGSVQASFTGINAVLVNRLREAWSAEDALSPVALAAALRAAAKTASTLRQQQTVDLVWSGPSTGFVPIRHTEQVLREVIDYATARLFVVSFVAYEVPSIVQALHMAAERGVHIDILLEASTEHGGTVTFDSVQAMKRVVPTADVYVRKDGLSGAVHAKSAVADGRIAFITSANLSTAAMERNMELGVLVKGGRLPEELQRHLNALVTTKTVAKV